MTTTDGLESPWEKANDELNALYAQLHGVTAGRGTLYERIAGAWEAVARAVD
jgi:hypothetical protein